MNERKHSGPEDEQDEVGAIDPRRGPIPTEASDDEVGMDTRDLESDKKESDETDHPK